MEGSLEGSHGDRVRLEDGRGHRGGLHHYPGLNFRAVIPDKKDQIAARQRRGSRGGRPPAFDGQAYRGRNVVERYFALAKQWRGLATRYDKLAITYRAAVTVCAILTWLRA